MLRLQAFRFAAIAALIAALFAGGAKAGDRPLDERLADLRDKARVSLTRLVHAPAVCVRRHDSDHAVFHGCYDWHSAAHGVWSLLAYRQMTDDIEYMNLVRSMLTPEGIAAERQLLRDTPDFEMPYGRAWFLRLAIAHGRLTGYDDVIEMADEVARSMLAYYQANTPDPRAKEYANPAWALINLTEYADFRPILEDDNEYPTREQIAPLIAPFLAPTATCSLEEERAKPEFMAACMNWGALIALWTSKDDARTAISRLLFDADTTGPVTEPASIHHNGLNFSRAWAAWMIYARTGDERFARIFAGHMEFQMDHPEWWEKDYMVSHWVAQFGIFAWQRFLEDKPQ